MRQVVAHCIAWASVVAAVAAEALVVAAAGLAVAAAGEPVVVTPLLPAIAVFLLHRLLWILCLEQEQVLSLERVQERAHQTERAAADGVVVFEPVVRAGPCHRIVVGIAFQGIGEPSLAPYLMLTDIQRNIGEFPGTI